MNNITENKKEKLFLKSWVQSVTSMTIIFGILIGFIYFEYNKNTVFIENSYLDAPLSNVSSATAGVLNAIYVKEGDIVSIDQNIALIGSEIVHAKESGVISTVPHAIGGYYNAGQTVTTVVVNNKMRVIGSVEETKGLKKISSGQKVIFTVDAFPGKKYEGVVDGVSAVSNESGVAFSISDKRPIKKFNVYVEFDHTQYPELKGGMSTKMTIYTNR